MKSRLKNTESTILERGIDDMKIYYVVFDFADYDFEHVHVYADNKREVRRIMKNQYGNKVYIRSIEEEKEKNIF